MRQGLRALAGLTMVGALVAAPAAHAGPETIYGLTATNRLVTFSTATPGNVSVSRPISGLQSGETLLAIDVRPSTGVLYGIGTSGRLYTINVRSASASQPAVSLSLSGSSFGMDFNPVTNRLKVTSDSARSVDVDPAVQPPQQTPDNDLSYTAADSGFPAAPHVAASAYNLSFPGSQSSRLYSIDSARNVLVLHGAAAGEDHALSTVGSLGVDVTDLAGFDIAGSDGTAYAALQRSGEAFSRLYELNLGSGGATERGVIAGEALRGIAVARHDWQIFGTTFEGGTNRLFAIDANNPTSTPAFAAVFGLQPGEVLRGIDVRPATGELFGVGSTNRVYRIQPSSGLTGLVGPGPFTPGLTGSGFGIDFDPATDRLRMVSDDNQNFRFDPNAGTLAAQETALNPGNPDVVAAAYANNTAGASSSTLYGIDTSVNTLVRLGGPDGNPAASTGTVSPIGALGFDPVEPAATAFDIAAQDGSAFLASVPSGSSTSVLFRVDLGSGVARSVGVIGNPAQRVTGLAVSSPGTVTLEAPASSTMSETEGPKSFTISRTAAFGVVTVNYAVENGTATAGSDFPVTQGAVTFETGELSKTFSVPVTNDSVFESNETFTVRITSAAGGARVVDATRQITLTSDDLATTPPPPPADPSPQCRLVVRGSRLVRTVSVRGIPVSVTCNEAVRLRLEMRIAESARRRYRFRSKILGLLRSRITAPGTRSFTIPVRSTARRDISRALRRSGNRRLRRVRVTVRLVVKDRANNQEVGRLGVTLRR